MNHIPPLIDHNIWNGEMLSHHTCDDVQSSQKLYTFQICECPQSLFQSCPCCYSQGISHLQSFYLRHDSLQIQVSAVTPLIGNLSMRKAFTERSLFFNRDTLAENVPCLHFLAQVPSRDCITVSHSESSFTDSGLSRQSSVSKTKFHRVSSMSTTDTVSLMSVFSVYKKRSKQHHQSHLYRNQIHTMCCVYLSRVLFVLFCTHFCKVTELLGYMN